MTGDSASNGGKISSAAEGSNLLDGGPITGTSREGLDVKSTQSPGRREASFTFEQIEAGCAILRRYSSAVVAAYNEGGEIYELDFLREIAEALGTPKVMR